MEKTEKWPWWAWDKTTQEEKTKEEEEEEDGLGGEEGQMTEVEEASLSHEFLDCRAGARSWMGV